MTVPVIQKAYVNFAIQQQLHYRYVLPSSPSANGTIVFLHKSASSSVSWGSLMLHYAQQGFSCFGKAKDDRFAFAFDAHRLDHILTLHAALWVAPDMPGFGQSFDPTDEQAGEIQQSGTEWFANVFLTAFERLGITMHPFHIIGHHSGASLATQIAATQPHLVASICQIGATTIGYEERQRMRERFLIPFNEPTVDGAHLQKTWDYLGRMGIGDSLLLRQRECIDHIRAWRGRMLIYSAVWDQDAEVLFASVQCPTMVLCARDDVLFEHMQNVKKVKPGKSLGTPLHAPLLAMDADGTSPGGSEARTGEVKGANFSLDLDAAGIIREWDAFQGAVAAVQPIDQ